MNPRRYPRTLQEAFPRDAWVGVIERHRRPLAERVITVIQGVVWFGVLIGAGAAIVEGWCK